jgi:hypothetical protein
VLCCVTLLSWHLSASLHPSFLSSIAPGWPRTRKLREAKYVYLGCRAIRPTYPSHIHPLLHGRWGRLHAPLHVQLQSPAITRTAGTTSQEEVAMQVLNKCSRTSGVVLSSVFALKRTHTIAANLSTCVFRFVVSKSAVLVIVLMNTVHCVNTVHWTMRDRRARLVHRLAGT